MIETKNIWINYINSCKKEINRDEAKIGIDWIYKSIGKESPILIYLDRPMGCQIGVSFLKQILNDKLSQVESQVWSEVGSQVRESINKDRGGAFWAAWCEIGRAHV